MLVVHNDDSPGMIGRVATMLGDARHQHLDMDVGQSPSGEAALMVDRDRRRRCPPKSSRASPRSAGVQSARAIDLG